MHRARAEACWNSTSKIEASYKEKSKKDENKKSIAKLTHKQINKLQNYYGIAVRQYTGNNVYELKKAIGAILYHLSEADLDDMQHQFCPQHPETWCAYQLDILHNKNNYSLKNLLPKAVQEVIKPILMNLSDTDLLSKSLHGKTQNNNEWHGPFKMLKNVKNMFSQIFCLILIFKPRTTFSKNLGVKRLVEVL